ncbi:zinc finger protein 260-like [Mytilus californianus]|uniref:zinc finger protein 260-like n=1 Tax=Mytilus californianus TaxID=6549 RepID=UPI0022465F31|nr:zinc finger protein 260-like [Mytilus californianus]XP_052064610.1 zinc finger protein 260-like [Mytilus californianus]
MTTVEITAPVGGDTRLLALRVTPEQEIAIYAFFQINGWTIVTEEIAKKCENCGIGINGGDDPPTCHICQKAIENAEALMDETNEEENGEMSDTGDIQQNQPTIIQVQDAHGKKIVYVGNAMTVAKQPAPPPPVKTEIVTTNSVGTETRVPQSVAPKIYNVNNSAENRPYKCEHCGKHFRKKSHVVAHVRYHNGETLPKCNVCGKEFLYKHNLISHMTIHSGERPFHCTECQKTFRRKDDLQVHMRTHTGERPYVCDICGKAFTTQNQLPKHRRTHTGEKPYECEICHKCFRTKPHLEKHYRTHSGERPYPCVECGRAFSQNAHLMAHMRIHTGEKPYKCDLCDKAFKESKTLKKHKLIHENGMPYICTICGKGFLRSQNLDVHMCVHSDDLPKYKRKLLMKKKLLEEIEAESSQTFDNSNIETDIITEETIAEVETHIHEAEQAGQIIQVQNVEDHHIKEEQVAEVVTDGQDENSIANSLLTLVEMITSSNQDAHTTTSANGNSHVDLSNVQIDDSAQRQNIIITTSDGTQIQQQDTVMEDGSMQEVKTIFVDEHGREIGTSNENVVITSMGDTQVTTEQVIDSVTGQYVDGNTYVMEVEYVEQQ